MGRIVKKRLAINHPNDLRVKYVVDDVFIFPTKKKAQNFVKKNPKD